MGATTKEVVEMMYERGKCMNDSKIVACDITGHVDTFVIKDEKNLYYRADKSKKIHVFVPSTYSGDEPYQVLYFFDAQNLFAQAGKYTDKNDPYGGWQLDLSLTAVSQQQGKNIIVVGIENADEYRELELFMEPKRFGKLSPLATMIEEEVFKEGYLDEFSAFIKETLHPAMMEKYNLDEQNIGIGGSSMGGIASFYCAIKELGFYKYVLSYSPAFGLYEMEAFEDFFDKVDFASHSDKLPKIHIYCGGADLLESQLLGAAKAMKETMVKLGYDNEKIFETFDPSKAHNEEAWREILRESFSFLL